MASADTSHVAVPFFTINHIRCISEGTIPNRVYGASRQTARQTHPIARQPEGIEKDQMESELGAEDTDSTAGARRLAILR